MNEFHIVLKSIGGVEVIQKRCDYITGYVLIFESVDEVFFKHYHSSKEYLMKEVENFIWGLNKVKENFKK